jgi:CheY-like chemotaxis protein/HPt (histidine-containing phosphotransfer) domain-containing protein
VLVVDDHPINRMLLMRQVTTLGYAAEAANDGREALGMWTSGRFRLVITDCNMPELDGYGLARAIRSTELATGRKRTLIIACTANALKGEAQICFAAGMDDYIAKPVELTTLLAKLEQWLPIPHPDARSAQQSAPHGESPRSAEASPPLIDREVLAEIAGGDAALEREVFAQFLKVNEEDVAALWLALQNHDGAQVLHVAHRIKGASNAIGATALAQVCGRLEAAARAKNWGLIAASQDAFHREAQRLNGYLETLV